MSLITRTSPVPCGDKYPDNDMDVNAKNKFQMWHERNCRSTLERIILPWPGYRMTSVILTREHFISINHVNTNALTAQNPVADQSRYVWTIHKETYRDLQRLCIIYSLQICNQIIERQLIVKQVFGNHVFHGGCHYWSSSIRRLGGVWTFSSIVNFSP